MPENALKKPLRYTVWVFIALFIAALIVSMLPVYAYCNQFNLYKYSDFWVHNIYAQAFRARDTADIVGNYSAYQHILLYPLYHICVAAISFFTRSIGSACVIFLGCCNIATVLLIRHYARKFAPPADALSAYAIDIAAALSLLIFCISSPLLVEVAVGVQMSPNAYHNPTLLAVRPIAIFCFCRFIEALKHGEGDDERQYRRNLMVFSATLFISVLVKPSFALVFLFGAGATVLIRLLRDFKNEWKHTGLPMLLAVAPTLLLMTVQGFLVSQRQNVVIYSGLAPLSLIFTVENLRYIVSVLLIPIVYFAFGGFKLLIKSDIYTCAFFQMLFGFILWYGTMAGRYNWSDLSWSYVIASFFMIVISAIAASRRGASKPLAAFLFAVYGVQVYYGISYILHVWQDGIFAYVL